MNKVDLTIMKSIAVLAINNPPVNALNDETITDIHTALSEVEKNQHIKVVIITGKGGYFVAGADIKEIESINNKELASQIAYRNYYLMDRIESFSIPVIASIDGACLGGGLELALSCHIRIASESAIFGFPEITLGIIPGAGGTQRLPKLVGYAKAIEMILTGQKMTAVEAKNLGLINRLCTRENLEKETMNIAERISSHGKVAIQSALISIRTGLCCVPGYRIEAEKFGQCFTTHDKKEGFEAFLNKRRPRFADC